MDDSGEFEEQRTYRRFQAPYGAVAAIRFQSRSIIGMITDISKGGLAFSYLGHNVYYKVTPQKDVEIDLLCGAKGFYLDKVKCKIILDHIVPDENSSGFLPTKKCRIQFADLTDFQESQLDFFIKNYTTEHQTATSPYL